MHEYRVTKYDPEKRDEFGRYSDEHEWTCYSDVGDIVLLDEYERIEKSYVDTAIGLLLEAEVVEVNLVGFDSNSRAIPYKEGETLRTELLERVIQQILRNQLWCRIESGENYIHFGWDYSMYIGVSINTPAVITTAIERGLYVENFKSPYHPSENDDSDEDEMDGEGVNESPEWITRGKTIKSLIAELQTFSNQDIEVRISLDDGESHFPISLVTNHNEEQTSFCVLENCES
jgi:hypothetical protein